MIDRAVDAEREVQIAEVYRRANVEAMTPEELERN
jgi:hypothetical protein